MGRKRNRKRLARVKNDISILMVLYDFGYRVRADGEDREQQFPCDLHGDGLDNKPSARVYPRSNSWYCVSEEERILTDLGWMPLRDLAQHRETTLHDGKEWHAPIAYFPKGEKDAVRITTTAGYSVVVTPDHEIEIVGRGWVPASDIQVGDIPVVPRPTPRFRSQATLPTADLNRIRYQGYPNLTLPELWSTEMGEVLGYIFGDGWVTPRKSPSSGLVGLTAHREDVEEARVIYQRMRRWSGGRGSEVHRTDVSVVNGKEYVQDQFVFTVGNDGFCEFFCRMGLGKDKPANQRGVPDAIWGAPLEGVRGFLRGIYGADGSAFRPSDRKGIRVNLYSVSQRFLHETQLLLLQFGIHSRVHPPSRTRVAGKRTHPAGYLQLATVKDILLFREHIGIANNRKQRVLDSFRYDPRGARPFRPTVKEIVPVGKVAVADVSMPDPDHPAFIAGGLRVHNCFACDATRDTVQTVREREDLSFLDAIAYLEKKYSLPSLPWEEDDDEEEEQAQIVPTTGKTFEDDCRYFQALLDDATRNRILPMGSVLAYWEGFDKLTYLVTEEVMDENLGRRTLKELHQRLKEAVVEEHTHR